MTLVRHAHAQSVVCIFGVVLFDLHITYAISCEMKFDFFSADFSCSVIAVAIGFFFVNNFDIHNYGQQCNAIIIHSPIDNSKNDTTKNR